MSEGESEDEYEGGGVRESRVNSRKKKREERRGKTEREKEKEIGGRERKRE